ncbi:hypothetical protein FACS1894105_13130 [Clostridia bacterium]|nr:hypothetical protein FACS1894105_13130 [Clostridia bacterium]
MTMSDREVKKIVVTDKNNDVLAVVYDNKVVEYGDYKCLIEFADEDREIKFEEYTAVRAVV